MTTVIFFMNRTKINAFPDNKNAIHTKAGFCQSVNKTPVNPQPDLQARIGITGRGEIVACKPEYTIVALRGVQVLRP